MQSEPEDLTMRVKSELDALQEAYRGAAVSEFSFNAYRRESSASEEATGRRPMQPVTMVDEVRHRRSEGDPSDGSSQPSSPPLPLHRSTPASSSMLLKEKLHSSDELATSGGRGSGSHDDDLHEDEDDEDEDEDDRGVSPPLMGGGGNSSGNNTSGLADSVGSSHLHHGNNGHHLHHHLHHHHQLYNPLFAAGPAGFQLGLAGAAMPLVGLVPGGGRGHYSGVESEPDRLSSLVASQKEISQQ